MTDHATRVGYVSSLTMMLGTFVGIALVGAAIGAIAAAMYLGSRPRQSIESELLKEGDR